MEFRTCRFVNCNFDYASVRAAKFLQCSFDHCTFKEATFKDCVFAEGETGSDWRYCDLSKAEFEKSNLSLNKFVGCQGYMLSFTDCAAPGLKADIEAQRQIRSQVIPGGLRFIRCKLQYAEFAPGDLQDSIFESCDLRDASFAGAKLNGASFRGSSLSNIDLPALCSIMPISRMQASTSWTSSPWHRSARSPSRAISTRRSSRHSVF